jgi:hypothetical protein
VIAMQITVDTNKDSKEDIQKVIRLLNNMMGEEEPVTNSVNENTMSDVLGFTENITSEPRQSEQPVASQPTQSGQPSNSGIMNLFSSGNEKPLNEVVEQQQQNPQPKEAEQPQPKEEKTNNGIRIIEY